MSVHDHSTPHNPLGRSDSPYTPGTPSGEALRWYEFRKSEALVERPYPPYKGKLPVVRIAATFILGMWGAIILGLLL